MLAWSSVASYIFFFFFFNDTATTEIYTLSLHDALPISFAPAVDLYAAEIGVIQSNFAQVSILQGGPVKVSTLEAGVEKNAETEIGLGEVQTIKARVFEYCSRKLPATG